MLINKGATVGEVVTIKLVTSEEIIGSAASDVYKRQLVERPLALVMGKGGLGLQPWLFTIDPDKAIRLPKDKVLVIEGTMKEMADSYLSGTSGIALA